MKKGIEIWRDELGIPHVDAENLSDMYWGNGYVHATDRGMQMLLMRILGQGRVSEILDSSDTSLQIDIFFHRMNWSGNVKEQVDQLVRDYDIPAFLLEGSFVEEVLASGDLEKIKNLLLQRHQLFYGKRPRAVRDEEEKE